MLSVFVLNVIKLSVVMLNVVMLNVVMLSVVTPPKMMMFHKNTNLVGQSVLSPML